MANNVLMVIVMLILAELLANIPEACLAQPELYTQEMTLDELIADQQGESPQDRELTKKIRKAVVNDKALSSYAHKVTIIASDGMVTLKGLVRSEEAKRAVEQKAVEIAGNGNVKNEIDIAPH